MSINPSPSSLSSDLLALFLVPGSGPPVDRDKRREIRQTASHTVDRLASPGELDQSIGTNQADLAADGAPIRSPLHHGAKARASPVSTAYF